MDSNLKQRIVGTAVLFGLAVIFIPMILDGPVERSTAPQSTGVPLELPETEEAVADPGSARMRDTEPAPVRSVPDEAPAAAGWAVQLGSFSARGNADALAGRLLGAGFEAFVQRVQVTNGTMYRVRVGPVADRDEAEALAARVRESSGEPAVVVEHP